MHVYDFNCHLDRFNFIQPLCLVKESICTKSQFPDRPNEFLHTESAKNNLDGIN